MKMGNCGCLCPCFEHILAARRRIGYVNILDLEREEEERNRREELEAMKVPPCLPKQFSKLYRLGDLLGSGTTSRVFRVYRHKRSMIHSLRSRLSSSESTTMQCLEKTSSRYNLMVDAMPQQFLLDSSDDEEVNATNFNDHSHNDHYYESPRSPLRDYDMMDYEPVVEKSLFVSSTSTLPLACKIIDKKGLALGIVDNDFVLFQLRKEIDILRRIQHPHIVRYYDYTETKNHILIITEYLSGGELFAHLAKNGPLMEYQAKNAFRGLFSAVAYLHDRGIIHRDIKAENVILSHSPCNGDSGSLTMKLIDFGFSTVTRHSLTESFLGTGGYIAPEIRQHKSYSTSVDDWALGVLVYCSLSARLPFGTSIELLPPTVQECEDLFKIRFPAQFWSHISSDCKDFISSLLRVDPLLRMTAKNALSHPWFADVAKMNKKMDKKIVSVPYNGCRIEHQRTFMHNCSNVNVHFLELPALHTVLRPIRSTLPLERSSRGKKSFREMYVSQRKINGRKGYPITFEEGAHTDGGISPSSSSSLGVISPGSVGTICVREELVNRYNSDSDTETRTSFATTTASSSCNNLVERSHNGEDCGKARHNNSTSLISSTSYKNVVAANNLMWDEIHHKNAGSLFFTTYMPSYGTSYHT